MMTDFTKIAYLNSLDPVKVCIHSADPTADGSAARIGTPVACTFSVADVSEPDQRFLASAVEFTITADVTVSHVSIYDAADNCMYYKPVPTPRALLTGDKYVLGTGTFIGLT